MNYNSTILSLAVFNFRESVALYYFTLYVRGTHPF